MNKFQNNLQIEVLFIGCLFALLSVVGVVCPLRGKGKV